MSTLTLLPNFCANYFSQYNIQFSEMQLKIETCIQIVLVPGKEYIIWNVMIGIAITDVGLELNQDI